MASHLNVAGDFGGWFHTNSCSPKPRQGEMWGWAGKFKLHEVHPNIWDTPLKFNIDFDIKNSHIGNKIDFQRLIVFKFRWCMHLHVWSLKPPQNASCFYLWRSLNVGSCKSCQSRMDDPENSSCKYSNICNFQPKCPEVVWNRTKKIWIASGADSLQTHQHVHQCGWGVHEFHVVFDPKSLPTL